MKELHYDQITENIMECISSLSDDITRGLDPNENKVRAESIKILIEAYAVAAITGKLFCGEKEV